MALDRESRWGFISAVLLYLAAAAAVAFTGAERHPRVVILAAALLLMAAAIANMTVRRVRDRRQLPGWLRMGVPLLLTLVATGLAVFAFTRGTTDGYGLFGICGAFITMGHFVAELRSRTSWSIWRGLVLLAVVAVACVVGVLMGASRPDWLLLALGALLVGPIGLTLLSTDVLRSGRVRPVLFLGAGAVLLGAGAVWLDHSGVDRYFVGIVAVVLALLVLAISADTQADVVLVATLVAFVWSGFPRAVPLDDDVVPAPVSSAAVGAGERVLVSLGDSYMSGEGAKRFYDGTNKPGEPLSNECRRAPTAYAHEILDAPEAAGFAAKVAFFACSGAVGRNIWARPQHSGEPPGGPRATQLQQLESLLDTEATVPLVLVSVGGNDAGFATIGTSCVAPGNCVARGAQWLADLQRVAVALDDAYDRIRDVVSDDVPVLAVPYPQPITADRKGCGYSLLETQEHLFLNGFVKQLNRVVANAARDHGFYYLQAMEQALETPRMRICDNGSNQDNLGVNFIAISDTEGLIDQLANPMGWLHNSLHPNERGHDEMTRVLADWMETHPSPKGLSDEPGSDVYDVASLGTLMGPTFTGSYCGQPGFEVDRCQLSDDGWMLTEVSRFLRGTLAPAFVMVLGAWLLSLGFLGATRPLWKRIAGRLDRRLFGLLRRIPWL